MPRQRGWAILDEDVLVLHQRRCCSLWLWIALKFHMDQSCPQRTSTMQLCGYRMRYVNESLRRPAAWRRKIIM